jgi:hypothetical protein
MEVVINILTIIAWLAYFGGGIWAIIEIIALVEKRYQQKTGGSK